jgi:acetyl esterase/lipase
MPFGYVASVAVVALCTLFAVRPRRPASSTPFNLSFWFGFLVYRPRRRPPTGPAFVHFHGGAFRIGNKSREARPLFHHLARHGCVCISANYRLTPHATFPDQLIDVKRVLAWIRERGASYGADHRPVVVSGSSAGAHLASLAALTIDGTAIVTSRLHPREPPPVLHHPR